MSGRLLKRFLLWGGSVAAFLVVLCLSSLIPFEPLRSTSSQEEFANDRTPLGLPVGGKRWGFVEWSFPAKAPSPSVVKASYGVADNKNTAYLSLRFLDPPFETVTLQEARKLFLRDVPIDYSRWTSGGRPYAIRFNGKDAFLFGTRFFQPEIAAPSLWRLVPLLLCLIIWGAARDWQKDHWVLAGITVGGVCLRWPAFQNYYSVPLEGDATGYWNYAHDILWDNPYLMGREPGFPWLLRMAMLMFGDSMRAARFTSLLFSIACVPATFFTVKRFGYSDVAGWVACALVAANPFSIHMSVQGLQLEFFSLLILLFALIWKSQEPFLLALCGGLLSIVRIQSFLSVIPLALYAGWRQRWPSRRIAQCFLSFAMITVPYFVTVKKSSGSFFYHLSVHAGYYDASEQFNDPHHPVPKRSVWDYIFRAHSPLGLLKKTLVGYGHIFFNPNNEFNQIFLNSHFRSRANLILFPFFCLGLISCLRDRSGRELLMIPLFFLGGLPFLQAEFREWRLLFYVAPFISMIAAIGLEGAIKRVAGAASPFGVRLPLCAAVVILAAPMGHAGPPAASPLDHRVKLDFGNAPLMTLLDWISGEADLAFVVRDGLDRETVTGTFSAATIRDVLARTLGARGLAFHQIGNTNTCVILAAEAPLPQDPGEGIDDPALNRSVSLRMKNASLPAYLDAVAKQAGLKFSISDDLKNERISARMRQATAREALSIAVIGKGLTYKKNARSGVYRIFRATPRLESRTGHRSVTLTLQTLSGVAEAGVLDSRC